MNQYIGLSWKEGLSTLILKNYTCSSPELLTVSVLTIHPKLFLNLFLKFHEYLRNYHRLWLLL